VAGVEPSRWASAYCQAKGLDVKCGTLRDLPALENEFDILTSWDVLEHVSDPMQELAETNNRLKLGGIFAFSTLHMDNWFPKLAGERWPWYMDMHLYYFTNSILKYMLEQSGFEVIAQKPYCHIITGEYLVRKLSSMGLPLTWIHGSRLEKLLKKFYIPFRFGDIQVTIARKVQTISRPVSIPSPFHEPQKNVANG
jgi:2-polyprenyl-3-methyl-5-hydroxy-6-metoxy-1,4-benzoquinol methylase